MSQPSPMRRKIGYRKLFGMVLFLCLVGGAAFAAGLAFARSAHAQGPAPAPKVIYEPKTELDFEGMKVEGEVKNPGEFYFQSRPRERFDSLVKRRKNFHREMLRDVVQSR
jgi:hypothetical protein